MPKRTWVRLLCAAVAVGLVTTACGGSGGGGGGSGGGGGEGRQLTGLKFLVGTPPGGGFDLTARTAAKAMEEARLARNVQVQNLPGAGNTIALQRLVNQKGNGKVMQQMGLGLVGGVFTNKSKATLEQTTAVARLTEEPEIVVVQKDSPYKSFDQLLQAWKADPGKLSVGGGSSPGGPDHLAPMLIAKTVGIRDASTRTRAPSAASSTDTPSSERPRRRSARALMSVPAHRARRRRAGSRT